MKKALAFIAQPGVPYPVGAVAHATAGAILGCIPPQLIETISYTPTAGAVVGAVAGVVVGFVAWLASK